MPRTTRRRRTRQLLNEEDLASDEKNRKHIRDQKLHDALNTITILVIWSIPIAVIGLFLYIFIKSRSVELAQDYLAALVSGSVGYIIAHLRRNGIKDQ